MIDTDVVGNFCIASCKQRFWVSINFGSFELELSDGSIFRFVDVVVVAAAGGGGVCPGGSVRTVQYSPS